MKRNASLWVLLPISVLLVSSFWAAHAAIPEHLLKGDWESFRQSDAGRKSIEPDALETNILAAAILHATNHHRRENRLEPLEFHEGARRAAALQAKIMRDRGSISHENPNQPKLRTLEDRVAAVGLDYRYIAENVATAFALQYESGKPFYTRSEGGETIFSKEPRGKPIPRHTYATFAESLVKNWMNSPGHRKNILSQSAKFMGASCFPARDGTGMTKFYCAQVFFTPR